ncbi:MAG: LTA synthase family protein [Flavobacteriales bacterium]|nr:LTA synthase family protein [Flavobacteriales bacterium]
MDVKASARDERFGIFNGAIFLFLLFPLCTFVWGNKFHSNIDVAQYSWQAMIDLYRFEAGYLMMLLSWAAILLIKTQRTNNIFRVLVVVSLVPLFVVSAQAAMAAGVFGKVYSFDSLQYFFISLRQPWATSLVAWLFFVFFPVALILSSFVMKSKIVIAAGSHRKLVTLRILSFVFFTSSILAFAPPIDKTYKASNAYDAVAYLWVTGFFPIDDVFKPNNKVWPEPVDLENGTLEKNDRNVVVIILESVRTLSTSLHPEGDANTTPYLAELAKSSYVVEQAITTVPHTSKSLVSINCGIVPYLGRAIFESTLGIPTHCIPKILNSKGYNSVLFSSSTETFENWTSLVDNVGFNEFYPMERLPKENYEMVNYFGYEDNIMLSPSDKWINEQKGPFYAVYFTGMTHHGYEPPSYYEMKHYSDNKPLNDYLNSIRYADEFVEQVISQYKNAGLYEDTVFVITSDHGQGFGEHNQWFHNNIVYKEGIGIPLVIHSSESRVSPKLSSR